MRKQTFMNEIVLNEKQKEILVRHLSGWYCPFYSPEEDQLAMNVLIEMAHSLRNKLNARDEWEHKYNMNLMEWFWSKIPNSATEMPFTRNKNILT